MNEVLSYLKLAFDRMFLRAAKASIQANERWLSGNTEAVSIAQTRTLIRTAQIQKWNGGKGGLLYLRAVTQDVYLVQGGLAALDGTAGELVSASALHPYPFKIRMDAPIEAVAPVGAATLVVMWKSGASDGLAMPGVDEQPDGC